MSGYVIIVLKLWTYWNKLWVVKTDILDSFSVGLSLLGCGFEPFDHCRDYTTSLHSLRLSYCLLAVTVALYGWKKIKEETSPWETYLARSIYGFPIVSLKWCVTIPRSFPWLTDQVKYWRVKEPDSIQRRSCKRILRVITMSGVANFDLQLVYPSPSFFL